MKKWVRANLKATISILSLLVVFLGASYVTATSDSLWANSGTITRTLVAEGVTGDNSPYFNRACDKIPKKENKYERVGGAWLKSGYNNLNNDCWTKTTYGLFGTGNDGEFIRMGNAGVVARLDMGIPYNKIALPSSDKLIVTYGNGTSRSRDMYMYDHLNTTLTYQSGTSGGVDKYSLSSSPSYWTLKTPGTSQNMGVVRTGYSNNGKWMVIEGGGAFFRLNMETKEVLTFDKPWLAYGVGLDPGFMLAISNDGRYATVSVGGNNPGSFYVYDLGTCVPSSAQIMEPATGCGKRDIKNVAMPNSAWNAAPGNVEFSNSGENISYNFYENGKMNRFMITAPGRDAHLLEYLALGDSFSSGEGDTDGGRYYVAGTDGNGEAINSTGISGFPYWIEKCHLSMRSYPYLLASIAGLGGSQFKSVACSGSNSSDLTDTSDDYDGRFDQMKSVGKLLWKPIKEGAVDGFIRGREAQVAFVKKYKPDVVTVGIGGNDVGFSDKLKDCVAFTFITCHSASSDRLYTALEIRNMYEKLINLYSQMKDASPATRFYAIGYPQIVSLRPECFAVNAHLDLAERTYINQSISYLNKVIKAAATKLGVYYIDVENSLVGHELCDVNLNNDVNGLKLGSDIGIDGQQVQQFGIIGNESFHPNDAGQARIASAISAAMNGVSITNFIPCAQQGSVCLPTDPGQSDRPSMPAYFTDGNAANEIEVHPVQGLVGVAAGAVVDGYKAIQRGANFVVNTGLSTVSAGIDYITKFNPGSIVSISIHSDPTSLGTVQADTNGDVSGNITLPASIQPGYHTIHLVGKMQNGDDMDIYQHIFVYAALDDLDGDGIANQDDTCGIVDPVNVDADNDGIDDACDGYIGEVESHPLYRVRNGDLTKGEIESRFYIERDVLEAKSKLNIVNDTDPDGDGWAVVGHTESNYDGATKTQFWIDSSNVPHLLLNGDNSITCAQLTPVSLSAVVDSEDRLLQQEQENSCPEPEQFVVAASEIGGVPENGGMGSGDSGPGTFSIQSTALLSQRSEKPAVQQALSLLTSTHPFQISDVGQVAGTSTKTPNYFDGPGKNTANVADQVGNTFLIWGSVMFAVLLGIILLIRSLAIFTA